MVPDPWNPMRWNQHCKECGDPLLVKFENGTAYWGANGLCMQCEKAHKVAERLLRGPDYDR